MHRTDWTAIANIDINSWSWDLNDIPQDHYIYNNNQTNHNNNQTKWSWGSSDRFSFEDNQNTQVTTQQKSSTNHHDDHHICKKAVSAAFDKFKKGIQISTTSSTSFQPNIDESIENTFSTNTSLSWDSTLKLIPSIRYNHGYIQTSYGDMQMFKFTPNDTINIIMKDSKLNLDPELSLIHEGNALDPDKSFKDYNIKNGSYLTTSRTVTVTIKHPKKKPKLLKLLISDKLSDLRRKIANLYGIHDWSFRIYLSKYGKELHDPHYTVIQYGIHDKQCLFVKMRNEGSFEIWKNSTTTIIVNTSMTKAIVLNDVRPTESVFDVKMRIQRERRWYHKRMRIIYRGNHLDDDNKTLLQVGVGENDSLGVVFKLAVPVLNIFNNELCDDDIKLMNYKGKFKFRYQDILYQQTMQKWYKTCNYDFKIKYVFKIEKNHQQNMNIYDAVLNTKNNKGKEDILFHGTSFDNIKKIMNAGFNRDYNIKSLYGKGTYFSNKSKIAAKYCNGIKAFGNIYAMLACKVYIGESTIGKANMNESELYMNDKVTQYDSLVNNLRNPAIFVINRDYHAVPCYIIVFTVSTYGQ